MRIGIFTGDVGTGDVDGYVDAAGTARDEGFSSYWVSQIFGHDALTLLAVIGREVPDIELGTAVVPTYPRHPMVLAGQALTTNAGGQRKARARDRAVAPDRDRGHVGLLVRQAGAAHARVPERAHALDPRRGGLRRRRDAHRPGPGDGAGLVADAGRAGRARAARCSSSRVRWPTARSRGAPVLPRSRAT